MAAHAGHAPRTSGRFPVSTDPLLVARFRAATALGGGDEACVPPTFPIVWLGLAAVKAALRAAIGEDRLDSYHVPLHLEQSFTYRAPLDIGHSYDLELSVTRLDEAHECLIEARVFDRHDTLVATFASKIRIVTLQSGAP